MRQLSDILIFDYLASIKDQPSRPATPASLIKAIAKPIKMGLIRGHHF